MREFVASENDTVRANLYLIGIIGTFIFLTLIAYLLTDGRPLCIIPIMRKCCPKSKWVAEHDKVEIEIEESNLIRLDMTNHVYGLKKAQGQTVSPRHTIVNIAEAF